MKNHLPPKQKQRAIISASLKQLHGNVPRGPIYGGYRTHKTMVSLPWTASQAMPDKVAETTKIVRQFTLWRTATLVSSGSPVLRGLNASQKVLSQ